MSREKEGPFPWARHCYKICHGQITVLCRSRVESFKPIVRMGFYRLPGRRVVRYQKSLEGREDPRGTSEHLSWLEDEEGDRAKRLE